MGSPITFSGFNQIDFGMILNAVMQQERAPLTRLDTLKKTLETQNTASVRWPENCRRSAQVTASQTTYASSLTDVVATGGTLTLTPTTGAPVTITISGSTTLSQLADLWSPSIEAGHFTPVRSCSMCAALIVDTPEVRTGSV